MNFKKAKAIIIETEWYQQGSAVKPLYVSYPWFSCSLMKCFGKKIPVKYEIFVNIKNDFMDDYISKRSLEKVGNFYLEKQKNDPNFISKLFANWRKNYVRKYIRLNQEILDDDFSKHSDHELRRLFENFNKTYLAVWHEAIFLDAFDLIGERILKETLQKEGKKIEGSDLDILCTPPMPSFLQRERLAVLELAQKNMDGNIKDIDQALEKISANYCWLMNDFAKVHCLGTKHFQTKLEELLKDKRKLQEEVEMEKWLAGLALRKQKIIKKYQLSKELMNTVNFLAALGNFRDERKSYNQMAGNTLRKFAQEFSKRAKISVVTVEYMFHWEIKNIFKLTKKELVNIKSRKNGSFYIITGSNKFISVSGAKADQFNGYLKRLVQRTMDLKGMPAYAGIIEGRVKIIRDQNEFHKMKRGDILIAPNTRPEFLPVLKIAGAIVTEEGGLTCHAAIVSRELKIPCIVGVQGITLVLKDGDRIEVDANQGIIKKI